MPDFKRSNQTISFPQSKSGTIALTSDINYPVTDVQLTGGTSVVSNTVATIPAAYQHSIAIYGDQYTNVYLTLVTSFATPFDVATFIAFTNGLSAANDQGWPATGTVRTGSTVTIAAKAVCRIVPGDSASTIGIVYHAASDAGVDGPIYYASGTGNTEIHSLSDTVSRII